jgi:cystathionine beta-lyase
VRERLDSLPPHLLGAPSPYGVAATLAAWTGATSWQRQALRVLDRNRHLVAALLTEHAPRAVYLPPDATYLAWIDLRAYDLGDDPAVLIREREALQLSPGPDYGAEGNGFVRLNFATSRELLTELVTRLGRAVNG